MNAVKISVLWILLLGVFSLPTLTATQLVSVLGEKTEITSLDREVLGDSFTFVKLMGNDLSVSYTRPNLHPVLRITNTNPVSKFLRVVVHPGRDSALLQQTVLLISGDEKFILHDRSTTPFNESYDLTILPKDSVDFGIEVLPFGNTPSYGTVSLSLREF